MVSYDLYPVQHCNVAQPHAVSTRNTSACTALPTHVAYYSNNMHMPHTCMNATHISCICHTRACMLHTCMQTTCMHAYYIHACILRSSTVSDTVQRTSRFLHHHIPRHPYIHLSYHRNGSVALVASQKRRYPCIHVPLLYSLLKRHIINTLLVQCTCATLSPSVLASPQMGAHSVGI